MDILHRVGIKSSLEKVYQALATRDGLAAWWTTDTQGESQVGGVIRFRFSADGKDIGGFDMKVLELQPASRVLCEPRPVLWVMDQDAWAKGLDYSRVPLDISRRVYESVRNAIIYYAGVHYERSGHLEFVHSVDGVRTLREEFDKVASHNEHHLAQIRLALGHS